LTVPTGLFFKIHPNNIDELTDSVCSYISFCVHCVFPTKTVVSYPNNKPWISKELNHLLREKRTAFRSGDKDAYAEIRKELNFSIKRKLSLNSVSLISDPCGME